MSREKQIEQITCKNCIHYEVCMYVNAQAVEYARAENCKLFKNIASYRKQTKAEWIISSDGYYPYCSRCKNEPKNGVMTDYCPGCGAKMKEVN